MTSCLGYPERVRGPWRSGANRMSRIIEGRPQGPAWTGAVVAALAAGLCLVAGCLHRTPARPQIVVLDIHGSGAVQRHVEDLARRRFDVVPARSYWVMAGRLHARPLTRRNVARVAESLRAVAVIESHVRGHKRHRIITLLVRDGKTGKVIEKHRLVVRHGRVVARSDRALERRFLDHLHTPAPPPPAPAAAPAPAPATARTTPTPTPAPAAPDAPRKTAAPARTSGAGHTRSGSDGTSPAASRTTAEAKPAPRTPVPPVHYDDSGQAIDDEVPPPPTR